MNTIHQQVLSQYLAVIRSQPPWLAGGPAVKEAEAERQKIDEQAAEPRPPRKGRLIDLFV